VGDERAQLEVAQVLAGLEADSLTWRDLDFDPGLGIATDSPFPIAYLEDAKAAEFDSQAFAESCLHRGQDGLDGLGSESPRDVGDLGDTIYKVYFDH